MDDHTVPAAVMRILLNEIVSATSLSVDNALRLVECAVSDAPRGPLLGYVYQGAALLAVSRATSELPGGTSWWTDRPSLVRVLAGTHFDDLYYDVAEALAQVHERAPDEFDSNWPDSKMVWRHVPEGLGPGDTYVVGDGMGMRATVHVVERGGIVLSILERSSMRHRLNAIASEAEDELLQLAGGTP